jgi:hypothetical protein
VTAGGLTVRAHSVHSAAASAMALPSPRTAPLPAMICKAAPRALGPSRSGSWAARRLLFGAEGWRHRGDGGVRTTAPEPGAQAEASRRRRRGQRRQRTRARHPELAPAPAAAVNARSTIRSVHHASRLLRRGTMSVPMALAHAAITSAQPATAANDRMATGTTIRAPFNGLRQHRTYDRSARQGQGKEPQAPPGPPPRRGTAIGDGQLPGCGRGSIGGGRRCRRGWSGW